MAELVTVCHQKTVECDSCEGTENVYHYCIQCPGNICDTCKLTHCNTRLTRNHRILPRTHPEVQQSRLSTKVYCEHHRDKEYVAFCTQCKVPCCPTCIAKEHSGHVFSDLADEILKVEKEMNNFALDLESYCIPETEKFMRTMTAAISDYKISADKVKQSAEVKIQQLIRDVQSSGKLLINVHEAHTKNGLTEMDVEIKKVNEKLSEMKRTVSLCRTAPADASLLIKRDKVKSIIEMNSLQITFPRSLTFNESSSCISVDMIGQFQLGLKMSLTGDRNGNQFQVSNDLEEVSIQIKIVQTIHQSGGRIIHTRDGQTWILDNRTNKISILDEHFKVIDTIKLEVKLEDMVLAKTFDENDTAVITTIREWGSKILSISRSNSHFLPLTFTGKPVGMCINSNQEIVIGVDCPLRLIVYSSDASTFLEHYISCEADYDWRICSWFWNGIDLLQH